MTTHIQWCDDTWNVVDGCTRVSDGCTNCYITGTTPFRVAGTTFDKPGVGGTTGVVLHPERLLQPLSWTEPRRIFANSMSDVFHDDVPDDLIARALAVMSLARRHTFQLLTKRHARMRSLLTEGSFRAAVFAARDELLKLRQVQRLRTPVVVDKQWPLPNLHLGVSVEHQDAANLRIPALLETPAVVRFLSLEPLIGPVDLRRIRTRREHLVLDVLAGDVLDTRHPREILGACPACIDWIVVGGESGKDARPLDPAWIESLRDQARRTRRAFFFKQYGVVTRRELGLRDRNGGDPDEWPIDWPREFPGVEHGALRHPPTTTTGGIR